jgi:hypothetical protein
VIWGGVHPTISYKDSLEFCDAVCIGEGIKSFVNYVEQSSENSTDINGIYFKKDNEYIMIPLKKLKYLFRLTGAKNY